VETTLFIGARIKEDQKNYGIERERMKLLITGPLGHIGSKFIHNIKPMDYKEVILIDNLSTQRYCSLFNLPNDVPFRFVVDDICTIDWNLYLKGVDVVVHLAAITDAVGSFENPDRVELVNYVGAERLARACVENGCRIVYISTTSVYGTQENYIDESCPTEELKPQSPYAASKLRTENVLHHLGVSDGLRFIVCRFGTIFGPSIGMRFHTAINKFCWQACVGQPITIWRTALNQKRPYLYLLDAVAAINYIIKTDRFDNQVYNVLTVNTTVGEIVNAIQTHVSNARIELVDSRIMNQLSYEVSCEKFKELGFHFKGNLAHGIGETIALINGVNRSVIARTI
jgi:nucleoside-diphosphate-sugar epimerase